MIATPHVLAEPSPPASPGAFASGFARTPRQALLAAAGAFGGVLPDLVMMTERHAGVRVTLPLHHANQTSIVPTVAIGVLTQPITTGLLLTRL